MHMIRPFAALRPTPEYAAQVAAPPYDGLSTEEARGEAQGKPWSFLHISKPEIDLPEGTDPYSPQVYVKAAENMRRMLDRGVLKRDGKPCYYVYRMVMNGHTQTGLAAAGSIADYDAQRIRRHELTTPAKEDDRVRQIDALNAHTGPVMVAYPTAPDVDAILADASSAAPEFDVTAGSGVRHMLWVIREDDRIARLTAAFDAMPALYIADGHHRTAAASRVAASRRAATPRASTDASYESFLCVAFPHHQLRILPYNRVVRDLNGLEREEFLRRVAARFNVASSGGRVIPERRGTFGLYLPGQWYRLEIDAARIPADPTARLDISLLTEHLLEPVLAIGDPRTDPRIEFIGGIRGPEELERRVAGGMAAAFSLYPTGMQDLMAVADAGRIMPPKSTWFEPKLADGLVSLVLD
ncbi:MAG: hypothetical protein A2W68_10970 [Betaproteobacteria bacterium RIFCSPLOWO2_02_64_14]|nr:MAG: hypothetical protein A2W68_10970 [Betaproteobacteria bacterium RIFCSPLOWO2_02_64_14]